MKKYFLLSSFFLISGFSFLVHGQTTFKLDKIHTFINFGVERFMVGEVTGRFNDFEGEIVYDADDLDRTRIDVTIKTESIDTGFEVRDGHLRSAIWLDAAQFPEMKFQSKNLRETNGEIDVTGDLTIHGVTKEVSFPIEIKGPFVDPTNSTTVAFSGELVVNRQDFGITFSKKMDNGHLFIGNEVKISIRALAASQGK